MKIKTKKAAGKRYIVMGSGRVKRGQAGKRHNTGKKRTKNTRKLRKFVSVDNKDIVHVRSTMPYSKAIKRTAKQ